ncbi:hypothetical protein F4677DRAFT_425873 [Hypoxylon crocopeplum]|nr:hypothetical protein F4677DRAFT_425873 [Hypoxylon crocopeplum]
MSSTTESKKSQASSPDPKTSQKSDKKDPGSDTTTEQKESKRITREELDRLFRKARELNANMSPEEELKAYPWVKYCNEAVPATADGVPDLWDEI